jgi:chromosome segregation ATPase
MKKSAHRAAVVAASALGALVLALPGRSPADPYRDYGEDYNRSYYGAPQYDEGQVRRDWQDIQRERTEVEQGRAARRRDWNKLQEERQEMDEARRAGDQDAYRHERQEAREAEETLQRDNAQIRHDKGELRQEEQALRHDRRELDEDWR